MFKLALFLNVSIWATAGTVSIKPFASPGIQITRADYPGNESFVESVLGTASNPAAARNLLPYSIVLENETGRTITAYTLHLTFVDSGGRSGRNVRQYFNFETQSNGMEILSGTKRLVTPLWSFGLSAAPPNVVVGPADDAAEALSAKLRSQAAVALSLDLVVLDDGQVLGPDDANTLSYLEGYLAGEHETASFVLDAKKRGLPPDRVSSELQRRISALQEENTFGAHARATQARRFLRLVTSSPEAVYAEANRVLNKEPLTLHR